MAKSTIPNSGLWSSIASLLNAMFTERYNSTGWAQYADTQYTDVAPFSIAADTDTLLPNNAGNVIESQKPSDITTYYDGTYITGRNGDGLAITIDFNAVPTDAGTTYIEVWIDIGGSVGQLYKRIITFHKGVGNLRPINFTVVGYTLDTWEANGGRVYVRSNGTADLHGMRYVLTSTHRAF